MVNLEKWTLCGAPSVVRFLISAQLKHTLVRAPQNIPHFPSACEGLTCEVSLVISASCLSCFLKWLIKHSNRGKKGRGTSPVFKTELALWPGHVEFLLGCSTETAKFWSHFFWFQQSTLASICKNLPWKTGTKIASSIQSLVRTLQIATLSD